MAKDCKCECKEITVYVHCEAVTKENSFNQYTKLLNEDSGSFGLIMDRRSRRSEGSLRIAGL